MERKYTESCVPGNPLNVLFQTVETQTKFLKNHNLDVSVKLKKISTQTKATHMVKTLGSAFMTQSTKNIT